MTAPTKHLLLAVDDEPDILTLNRMILEQAGFEVVTAGDGVDAIQKAVDFAPDLILLDVMMPRMNGYQVCRLLKNDPRTSSIPIIICTVKSLESEKLYAYTSGADDYLVKPFDKDHLVDLVKKVLGGKKPRETTLKGTGMDRLKTSTDSILSDVNRLLDRRLMELTILQDLQRAISGTLDLDGILKEVGRSLLNLGYATVRILLLEEAGRLEERPLADGPPIAVDLKAFPAVEQILYGKEVVLLSPPDMEKTVPPGILRVMMASSLIMVPLQAKGNPIGLMIVDSLPDQPLDRNQREFLRTLASQASLAIENANLYEKTLQLSVTDGLTGIYNHRYFRQRLDTEIARAKRYGNTLGLLILDIDHFKAFNDRYGHLMGDAILREVAVILEENTRDVDVVARYGGEEFGVILSEIDIEEAVLYAERIRDSVEKLSLESATGSRIGVTVSLGVAVCTGGDINEEEFIHRADKALYQAKNLGRNRVCVWKGEDDYACPLEDEKIGPDGE